MSEEWHKTHAVLLKSVAQAQGVLLAGLNEICGMLKRVGERAAVEKKEWNEQRKADDDERAMLIARDTQRFMELSGKIEAIGNCLAGLLTFAEERKLLLCADCHKDFEHCKCKVFAAVPSTKRKPCGRRKCA
jgi:hypothetical protein